MARKSALAGPGTAAVERSAVEPRFQSFKEKSKSKSRSRNLRVPHPGLLLAGVGQLILLLGFSLS
jgi:hypothetical protein